MDILIDEGDLEGHGGQEICTLQMARALHQRGHRIDLLFHRSGSLMPEYRDFCASLRRAPGIAPDGNRPVRTALGSMAKAGAGLVARPDVVYLSQPFGASHGALIAARHRVPLVCHLHLPPITPWPLPLRAALPRVDRFIAVSESIRASFADQGVGQGRTEVVHNGIDLDAYTPGDGRAARQALGIPSSAFVVAYLGRIDPPKGVEVLVEAYRRLGLGADEGRLLVAGQPRGGTSQVELDRHAAQLRAACPPPAGLWLGRQDDIVSLYRAADVVVLPSLWEEPFGRVLIEAMACGRPAVGSAVGGIPEILSGAMSRFRVPPGDPGALAAQLASLRGWQAREPGLQETLRDHVRRHFALAGAAAKVERILWAGRGRSSERAGRLGSQVGT